MGKSVLKEESYFDPLVFEDLLRFRNGLSYVHFCASSSLCVFKICLT